MEIDQTVVCTIITSVISIVGFVISYRLIIKQKSLAVQQQQNEWQIKEIMEILDDVLNMIRDNEKMIAGIDVNEKTFRNRMRKIDHTIVCYGTDNSVKIWNYFIYMVYEGRDDNMDISVAELNAPLALLVMQIKYDITHIKTSPKTLYIEYASQKMLEYPFYDKSIEEINKVVDFLKLPDFLRINDNCAY